jgi:hypothetical protein
MAHFYGYLQGNRGVTTRCGTKQSGIMSHIRSWTNDIYIKLSSDEDGKDQLEINISEPLRVIRINGIRYSIRCDNEEIFRAEGWN